MDIALQIAKELNLKLENVKNAITLIDEGNTIPFIARYRKELTGSLNDEELRNLDERLTYLRSLQERREEIARLLTEQGVLTPELQKKLDQAKVLVELEDIYRPYRPKRKTRASVAKEKGLEGLADFILTATQGDLQAETAKYINAELGVENIEEALQGAEDIIAELVSDDADLRKIIREVSLKKAVIITRKKSKAEAKSPYEMYYEYQEGLKSIPAHRILAINRGEKEDFLDVKLEFPDEENLSYLKRKYLNSKLVGINHLEKAVVDGYGRLILPSIEREIRKDLSEKAEEQAIKVFAVNLKKLLLQQPCKDQIVLGLDPGFRTGCKLAVIDTTGKVLATGVIYPTPPQNKIAEAKKVVLDLIEKHNITAIAIGNGTASRESERFIADLLPESGKEVLYTIVNEAGASVYSASKLAQEEFPDFDVTLRSAVSIARRLNDPLAELVKIEPKAIGVGQYQHDVNQKLLSNTLQGVVEDCVNSVGVNLNTASPSLLSYVSGVSGSVAKKIIAYREENINFSSRKELLKVAGLGPKAFQQCAGFLRIPESDNKLDNTSVHPESYSIAKELLQELQTDLGNIPPLNDRELEQLALKLEVGLPTLKDIVNELKKPGRDPREDLPAPVFKMEVKELEDLQPGMVLTGVVRNVVDFGAFIDIGVHQDGLVHISAISDKFIKNPLEAVNVGDVVKVKVLSVDLDRKRIALSMKDV